MSFHSLSQLIDTIDRIDTDLMDLFNDSDSDSEAFRRAYENNSGNNTEIEDFDDIFQESDDELDSASENDGELSDHFDDDDTEDEFSDSTSTSISDDESEGSGDDLEVRDYYEGASVGDRNTDNATVEQEEINTSDVNENSNSGTRNAINENLPERNSENTSSSSTSSPSSSVSHQTNFSSIFHESDTNEDFSRTDRERSDSSAVTAGGNSNASSNNSNPEQIRPGPSRPTRAVVRKSNLDDTEAPPSKIRKLNTSVNDDDGETCPICLEQWTNSGEHRLVSLKCGHLFGAKCVEYWLKSQPARLRSCPTCKTKASVKEMRHIYARKLVAADNSEVCALQRELELTQSEKNRIELECMQLKMTNSCFMSQLTELRSRMTTTKPNVVKNWSFALEKNIEISDGRVLTYNCRSYDLYVSQKSNVNLFPGYGVKKFNCVDYKFSNYIHLHKKAIRDIAYNSNNDLLLSASLDGTARIIERGTACLTAQPADTFPFWSCAWDETCQNKFYVGGASGNLLQYDLRNLSQPVCNYNVISDKSPVASICSTPYGLISCQLNSCWLWKSSSEPVLLPVEGPFMSVSYETSLHKLLVACRPNRSEKGRLLVCKFEKPQFGETQLSCLVEKTFQGSARASVLCKSAWVKAPFTTWVASHSESDSSLYLHNLDGGRPICIPAADPALDVCNIQVNEENMLATVSDSRLRIYKAVARS